MWFQYRRARGGKGSGWYNASCLASSSPSSAPGTSGTCSWPYSAHAARMALRQCSQVVMSWPAAGAAEATPTTMATAAAPLTWPSRAPNSAVEQARADSTAAARAEPLAYGAPARVISSWKRWSWAMFAAPGVPPAPGWRWRALGLVSGRAGPRVAWRPSPGPWRAISGDSLVGREPWRGARLAVPGDRGGRYGRAGHGRPTRRAGRRR